MDDVISSLGRAARRYDAPSLILATVFGFSLGIDSLEGAKHIRVKDTGALIGLSSFPHLRTLRPALKSLAATSDPLAIQRAFAKAMLESDEAPPELFYVDDHFVTYWGARPVAKGYNIRRHLAEPGRDDTFCTDEHWRAICFSSGEPKGLSVTIAGVIGQLQEITDGRPAMVGFDRGGSYPKVFSDLKAAGMDWITWRRAPLAEPTVGPRRSWVVRDAKRRSILLADEEITLESYEAGPVRQLSAIEDGKVIFQVLTSNTAVRPGPLVMKLRGRWSIENFNKYADDHHGIPWLASYDMDEEADTSPIANPERTAARRKRNDAKAAVAEAERLLGAAMEEHHASVDDRIAAVNTRRDEVTMAKDALDEAAAALKGIPAKRPRNQLDPGAKRARPRLAARALQMVCRLLAYNAELDLARRLNAYLDDLDEYRAITRQLLHLGGIIAYRRRAIVVTLERPDSPRVARALGEFVAELNDGPAAYLNGDRRPITYRVAAP
ncbi:MAG: putative transposase [Acidimicrobiales bacterium]